MQRSLKKNLKKDNVKPSKQENTSKIRTLEKIIKKKDNELEKQKKEIGEFRKVVEQMEIELNRLKEEIKYKNQKLASKDLEFESYKKTTEERIFQLQAKLKMLEAKKGEPLSNQL